MNGTLNLSELKKECNSLPDGNDTKAMIMLNVVLKMVSRQDSKETIFNIVEFLRDAQSNN